MAEQQVKFLEDVTYDGGGIPHDARVFKKGATYKMDRDSADHWVKRRKAEYTQINPEGPVTPPPNPEAIGVPVSGKLDKATKELQLKEAEKLAAPVVPVVETTTPTLSAAEERAARGVADAEAGIEPATTKNLKAVTAPARDKTVKPATTRKK